MSGTYVHTYMHARSILAHKCSDSSPRARSQLRYSSAQQLTCLCPCGYSFHIGKQGGAMFSCCAKPNHDSYQCVILVLSTLISSRRHVGISKSHHLSQHISTLLANTAMSLEAKTHFPNHACSLWCRRGRVCLGEALDVSEQGGKVWRDTMAKELGPFATPARIGNDEDHLVSPIREYDNAP